MASAGLNFAVFLKLTEEHSEFSPADLSPAQRQIPITSIERDKNFYPSPDKNFYPLNSTSLIICKSDKISTSTIIIDNFDLVEYCSTSCSTCVYHEQLRWRKDKR
ncbi:hypothetical protein CEXT_537711 [Caerostris extrusa]|uniref:Uncharacterized protein n=1 Tax=Caerostris extrusa TaxID=172846 RepID=A0AAV4UEE7_CAEEX|nr:hypothetical protein CEXT_537711 [Caerostris extrusa]